jgi:hypothetical protein
LPAEHLLVCHGRGVHGPLVTAALGDACDRVRKGLPRLALKLPSIVMGAGPNTTLRCGSASIC